MLAVTLEHVECVTLLLDKGASVNVENKEGWTGKHQFKLNKTFYILSSCDILVVQEAVATGNKNLLSAVLAKRDIQRHTNRMHGVPSILCKLKEASGHLSWIAFTTERFISNVWVFHYN